MSWSNTCYQLPRVRSHDEAEAFFNGASSMRSNTWGAHERPLGRRPDYNKRIVRHAFRDADTYVYELTLYNTPLATYRPDGEIRIVRYDTKMSRDFLDAVLPGGLSAISHNGATMIRANTPDGPAWYLGGKGALEFVPCGHNWWRLNGGAQARVRQSMDLKRAAQIRKAAQPFLTWVMATRALCGTSALLTGLRYPGRYSGHYPATLEELQDIERWPELAHGVSDRTSWIHGAYHAFGARTEHLISDHEPPKRGLSHQYS